MIDNDKTRPDPDQLLRRIQTESQKTYRGKLRIFFGSSAGVGKTYAMLSAAKEQLELGKNVLVGIVETHGRPETERLLEGVPIMQPLEIPYRSMILRELDLEAALTRKPDILLVDELAHSNAPGCRHPKRWNDVVELLNAGINVYTTLNVQHIESLSDLVTGATGIWMKETIPDMIFDMADDVVLVDIDEDDLIKRLHEGKVYLAPGAKAHAAENFFKKSNLSTLRELALRRTADRVDAERKATEPLGTTDRITLADRVLVCIGLNSFSIKLLRTAKRMAGALKAPWTALFVDDSGLAKLSDEKARHLEMLERMVERMDGTAVTIHGTNIADEIIAYAQRGHFTKIVVGKDFHFSFRHLLNGYLVDKIIRKSGPIDVYVVTDDSKKEEKIFSSQPLISFRPFDFILTLLVVVAFTIPGFMLPQTLVATDQALLYLVGSLLVAERFGLAAALFYALTASTFFNVFFLAPIHDFSFAESDYITTFVVMIMTGSVVARQASRSRAEIQSAREKEEHTRGLYALTRALAATRGRFPVSETVGDFIKQNYDVDVTVWMVNSEQHPAVVLGDLPEETYYKDFGALQWCFENAQNAGRGTSTMPSAAGFYLPLLTGNGSLGVLGIFPKKEKRLFTREEISSFETLASLLASALDRVRSGEIADQILYEKEERDEHEPHPELREPASAMETPISFASLHLKALDEEALKNASKPPEPVSYEREKLAQSLLVFFEEQKAKLGGTRLNKRPASILNRISTVTESLKQEIGNRKLDLRIPVDLPDVMIDFSLTDQLLSDLLLFIVKRTGPVDTIGLGIKREGSFVQLSLTDKGEPLEEKSLVRIFETYTTDEDREHDTSLSVAAGIVRLHGGTITAKNRPIHGIEIHFTLPIA